MDNVAFQPITDDEAATASKVQADTEDDWVAIMPVPEGVRCMLPPHKLGKPDKVWRYLNGNGMLCGAIARFDLPHGKEMRPLTYCEKGDQQKWRW
jgi:hypothetical protein